MASDATEFEMLSPRVNAGLDEHSPAKRAGDYLDKSAVAVGKHYVGLDVSMKETSICVGDETRDVAAIELTHRDIVASVQAAVKESGADPAWLALELTERMLAEETPKLMAMFHQLREPRVGLSVDDFGVGYSSFRYVDLYPLTKIKIDKALVGEMPQSAPKRIIIGAVIEIGRELGLDIVAEGIETEAQREALSGMNCPFGQGYLFGAPVEPDVFKARAGTT